jgi:hypothetical protein
MTRTTFQEHARLQRKVLNLDRGGTHVMCVWADCDHDGYENHKVVLHEHARSIPCDSSLAKHIHLVFCSDRHKQYYLACSGPMAHDTEARHNGHIAGNLPPGYRPYLQ